MTTCRRRAPPDAIHCSWECRRCTAATTASAGRQHGSGHIKHAHGFWSFPCFKFHWSSMNFLTWSSRLFFYIFFFYIFSTHNLKLAAALLRFNLYNTQRNSGNQEQKLSSKRIPNQGEAEMHVWLYTVWSSFICQWEAESWGGWPTTSRRENHEIKPAALIPSTSHIWKTCILL